MLDRNLVLSSRNESFSSRPGWIFPLPIRIFPNWISGIKYLLESRKMDFDYFEFPEMFHDWILIPQLKETKQAIAMIKDLLEQ